MRTLSYFLCVNTFPRRRVSPKDKHYRCFKCLKIKLFIISFDFRRWRAWKGGPLTARFTRRAGYYVSAWLHFSCVSSPSGCGGRAVRMLCLIKNILCPRAPSVQLKPRTSPPRKIRKPRLCSPLLTLAHSPCLSAPPCFLCRLLVCLITQVCHLPPL